MAEHHSNIKSRATIKYDRKHWKAEWKFTQHVTHNSAERIIINLKNCQNPTVALHFIILLMHGTLIRYVFLRLNYISKHAWESCPTVWPGGLLCYSRRTCLRLLFSFLDVTKIQEAGRCAVKLELRGKTFPTRCLSTFVKYENDQKE